MKYIIIGTAGHVDHGKSALIKALTGTDTDRLKEEKERGISIDLGFASLSLSEDIAAGIVDVPGHERFLKNMLAGTGGIDLALLTIAADEGVMPQTREHLAMLQLYGVKHGVVVINKIDKVDQEWLALVREEAADVLRDTFLANAPVCYVSAITGAGLPELRNVLAATARQISPRDARAPFRMWLDRVFSVKGHGAVVTGSVLSGQAKVGDTLTLLPSGKPVKVRGLETHGRKVDVIYAGQRAAFNLSGVDKEEMGRGMALTAAGRGQVARVWDVAVEWRQKMENVRGRLHLGTGEFIGRIYKPQRSPAGQYRLALEEPIGAGAGDKGILRLYSPQHLLGGVVMLGAVLGQGREYPNRLPLAAALDKADGRAAAAAILSWQKRPVTADEIRQEAGYLPDDILESGIAGLVADGQVIKLERFYLTKVLLTTLGSHLFSMLDSYHRLNPSRFGAPKEELRQKLGIEDKVFEVLLQHFIQDNQITAQGAEVALPAHAGKHQDWQRDITGEVERALAGSGLIDVSPALLAEKLGLSPANAQKVWGALVKEKVIIRLGEIHVYRKTIQNIVELIQRHFRSHPGITVAELRDMLNTTRKFALPVLEYMDVNKYTVRDGDIRRPGPKIRDLSE
ncbi:MAG: selenocysteine-specific translation elongation factor [Negativicutes bacterium]|nr:selenocysteine-specific translation elongation factor [Negativicutes bacterium]